VEHIQGFRFHLGKTRDLVVVRPVSIEGSNTAPKITPFVSGTSLAVVLPAPNGINYYLGTTARQCNQGIGARYYYRQTGALTNGVIFWAVFDPSILTV